MPTKTGLNRRTFVTLVSGAAFAGVLATPVSALTDKEAADLIQKLVNDINTIINSGKSEAAMYRDFETLFVNYGDVPIIAKKALGVPWRTASASQRSRFTSAFQHYIAIKYGKRFREFIGGRIEVVRSAPAKGGHLVNSVAHLSGVAPFAVDWQVSGASGQNKMFNIYLEGISMLATERTEIAAMLDARKGNLETLIADLNKAS